MNLSLAFSLFLWLPFSASFQNHRYQFLCTNLLQKQTMTMKMTNQIKFPLNKKYISSVIAGLQILTVGSSIGSFMPPFGSESNWIIQAKEPLPSLEKCFDAVRRELAPDGESINRLQKGIETGNWEDIKLFTREYDAGFRGYVMKSAWKQIDVEETQKRAIEISNSFTFDLIALNKASRVKDTEDAYKRLGQVKQDLADFLALEKQ